MALAARRAALKVPHLAINRLHLLPDAVARHDAPQLVHALARCAALRHPMSDVAEMNHRLSILPLLLQAAVIDPRRVAVALKMPIDQMRPLFPPLPQLLPRVHRRVFLGGEAVAVERSHRYQQMRVVIAVVARRLRRVYRDIDRVAPSHELLAGKIFHEADVLLVRQLVRQRHFDLAGKLRVLAVLGSLGMVPKRIAVIGPCGRRARRHDRRELDPLGPRLIKFLLVGLFVAQPLPGTIGGGGNGALPLAPTDYLRREMKDRHAPRCLPFSPCRMAGRVARFRPLDRRSRETRRQRIFASRTVGNANI